MALLQISEPGLSAAPHQRRLAAGIDLGTTNSLVATVRSGQAETLPDHQGRYLLPSVVNYHASGLTVGYDARLNAAQDPANTISSVKRMMGRSLADIQNRYPHLPYQLQASENGLPMIQTAGGLLNPIRVSADILKTDIPALVREKLAGLTPIVCANLPYNITTPAITALLESKCFESITVLVQKEVAERLCAAPGTAAYGAFSVYMQYHTAPRLLFEVGRECFQPQPKVTSAVLRAEVRKTPPVAVEDEKFFFRVVYAAFALRRKTIVNSLMTGFGSQLTKEQVTEAVVSAGLAPTVRGEKLGLEEFARLARALAERLPA